MESIVESNVHTVAKSPSPPNNSAKSAVLVAHGIDKSRNTVYFIEEETGKNATEIIATKDITTSLKNDVT